MFVRVQESRWSPGLAAGRTPLLPQRPVPHHGPCRVTGGIATTNLRPRMIDDGVGQVRAPQGSCGWLDPSHPHAGYLIACFLVAYCGGLQAAPLGGAGGWGMVVRGGPQSRDFPVDFGACPMPILPTASSCLPAPPAAGRIFCVCGVLMVWDEVGWVRNGGGVPATTFPYEATTPVLRQQTGLVFGFAWCITVHAVWTVTTVWRCSSRLVGGFEGGLRAPTLAVRCTCAPLRPLWVDGCSKSVGAVTPLWGQASLLGWLLVPHC